MSRGGRSAWDAFAAAGFLNAHWDAAEGGLQLPEVVLRAALTYFYAANVATATYSLVTIGAANLLRGFGSADLKARFLEPMILRSRKIDGAEALRNGLVHALHPVSDLKAAAQALGEELATKPPIAVAGVLRCVVGAADKPLPEALAEERRAYRRCAASADQAEGFQAFSEKRQAVFTGI